MKKNEEKVAKDIDKERKKHITPTRRRLLTAEEPPPPEWVNSPFDTASDPPPHTWDTNKYVRPMTPGHANFVFLLFGGKAERGEAVSESTRRDLY